MTAKITTSYDMVCFKELLQEVKSVNEKTIEKKIKQRLKYHKLGDYNQIRVDYIRTLDADLSSEIGLYNKSGYFKKTSSEFTVMEDFDLDRMITDYSKKYKDVAARDIFDIVNLAVHWYYTR